MGLTITYQERNMIRQNNLDESTMKFVGYFMELGDDQAAAELKVSQVSTESAALIYPYIMGNISALIDSINASSLPFMDQAAKDYIIDLLSA
jgi:hypothetical protein